MEVESVKPPSVVGELRPLPGKPGYFASDRGYIWSCRRGTWTKLAYNVIRKSRVRMTNIYVDGRTKHYPAAKLVLEAWVGPRPSNSHLIAYADGDKGNTAPSNLSWMHKDQWTALYSRKGSDAARAKLDEVVVREIRLRVQAGERAWAQWAARCKCTQTAIKAACKRLTFLHTDHDIPAWVPEKRSAITVARVRPTVLTEDDVREARRRYNLRESMSVILESFPAEKRSALKQALKGNSWQSVK